MGSDFFWCRREFCWCDGWIKWDHPAEIKEIDIYCVELLWTGEKGWCLLCCLHSVQQETQRFQQQRDDSSPEPSHALSQKNQPRRCVCEYMTLFDFDMLPITYTRMFHKCMLVESWCFLFVMKVYSKLV